MDELPVVRPDGATWSRYWWPRPMENPELLPAAHLPPQLRSQLLPADAGTAPIGQLGDALYARLDEYVDEARIAHFYQAVIAQQHANEALRINTENRARQQAIIADVMRAQQQRAAAALSPIQHLTSRPPGLPNFAGERIAELAAAASHDAVFWESWRGLGRSIRFGNKLALGSAATTDAADEFFARGAPAMPRAALPMIQHSQ